jgi:murein DD-endopeptidase MepM/ murein hydrolase activator NlpD
MEDELRRQPLGIVSARVLLFRTFFRLPLRFAAAWTCILVAGPLAARTINVPLADGFDAPVGKPDGAGYYVYRGFRPNGHLGEDWNGNRGGDTDLGDPVYATADGVVVFSADVRMGWGNVVIVRHAYRETDGSIKLVDSLYGHLHQRFARKDQILRRGQQLGTIGTAHGIYAAHLHFEMRKNLEVGMNRSKFPRDFSVYYSPRQFVIAHRRLVGGRLYAAVVDTFGPYESSTGKIAERSIPTRESSAPSSPNDIDKKIDALNKMIEQNKKTTQTLTDQEVDNFWDRLKQKLKSGKVTSGETGQKP